MTLHLVDSGHIADFNGSGARLEAAVAGVPERVREMVVSPCSPYLRTLLNCCRPGLWSGGNSTYLSPEPRQG